MRRYGSVVMLAARGTLGKLLLTLLLTGAAQAGLTAVYLGRYSDEWYGLWHFFEKSHVALAAGLGLLLLCGALALNGCDSAASRSRYTLRRLSVDERVLTALWSGCNTLCLLVFWGFQAGAMLLLCRFLMGRADPALLNEQTLFLAVWRSDYLHSLLPLAEWERTVCNCILAAALGVDAACFSYQHRHGRRGAAILILAAAAVVFFSQPMGEAGGAAGMLAIFGALTAVFALYNVWRDHEDED